MYKAYDCFANYMGLDKGQFILANGGENAIKNALLAIRPETLTVTEPGWGMIDVLCQALYITKIPNPLHFENENVLLKEHSISNFSNVRNCYFDYYGITNKISYDDSVLRKLFNDFMILDLTYRKIDEIKAICKDIIRNPNKIIVGSFDKQFGVGLRLGFAIFSKEWNYRMQLCREEYINPSACKFLKLLNEGHFKNFDSGERNLKLVKESLIRRGIQIQEANTNFVTVFGKWTCALNSLNFKIGEQNFPRIPIPTVMEGRSFQTKILYCLRNEDEKI